MSDISGPSNQRTHRAALNYATGLGYSATTMAIALVTTPLLLRWLGTERFGAWRASADWFGHLAFLELGLGGALAPLLAMAAARSDHAALRRTLSGGVRAYVRVAGMAALGGIVITVFIQRLVPVSPALAADLRAACLVATAALLLYPLAPFRYLADAGQRGYVVNLALLAQSLTATALALLFASRNAGITGQFIAVLAGQVVFHVLVTGDARRRHGGLIAGAMREAPDPETRQRIRTLNAWTLMFDLSGRLGLLTDNIVVAAMRGPSSVVPLFLTQRLAALAQIQLQGIGNASWAALGELHTLGRRDVFNARLLELTRLVAAMGVATLAPIAIYNHAFMRLWVGEGSYAGLAVTVLAAVNGLLLALVSLWGWCFSGTGQVRLLVPVMLTGAAINLTVSIAATAAIGLPGPLLGTLTGIVTTTLWYLPLQLARHFGTPAGALARAALGPLLWAAAPVAAIAWVGTRFPPASWPMLALHLAAAALALIGVWWFGALGNAERAHYGERIRMALRIGKKAA